MSVVACKVSEKKIEIASDSIKVYGWTKNKSDNEHSKLVHTNGIIVGSTGLCEESGLFKIFCSTRTPKSSTSEDIMLFMSEFAEWKKQKINKFSIENDYIILYGKNAFYVNGFFVEEILTFEAIGAGRDYALSALLLGNTPRRAVEVACDLSIYCSEPINYFEIKR